ncbi:MAG TPA: tRNA uridine-5-carboxymethylaminomethyl(34) synthesis enzyme MnmG, partial [Flavihumibacter sp.]|nr:tRNA uridine-5-carboxymethylaminomethyl(34) synthesis enzyme MnmG [Flavihumibacter sp.]
ILKRSEAYIGVLIDDLISKGTEEPYRMFTSRAEFRTLLRQDNADLRLTEMSYRMGLASQERMEKVLAKKNGTAELKTLLADISLDPQTANAYLESVGSAPLHQKQKLAQVLLRPNISLSGISSQIPAIKAALQQYDTETQEQAEIQLKYDVYIEKEKELVTRMNQMESLEIPDSFDYSKVAAISNEAREKLKKIKPRTLGQASRISGINPSDVQILMVYMGR